jgi:hypothetical protein
MMRCAKGAGSRSRRTAVAAARGAVAARADVGAAAARALARADREAAAARAGAARGRGVGRLVLAGADAVPRRRLPAPRTAAALALSRAELPHLRAPRRAYVHRRGGVPTARAAPTATPTVAGSSWLGSPAGVLVPGVHLLPRATRAPAGVPARRGTWTRAVPRQPAVQALQEGSHSRRSAAGRSLAALAGGGVRRNWDTPSAQPRQTRSRDRSSRTRNGHLRVCQMASLAPYPVAHRPEAADWARLRGPRATAYDGAPGAPKRWSCGSLYGPLASCGAVARSWCSQ